MSSMREYRFKKETEDVGCGIYKRFVQKEYESIGMLPKFGSEFPEHRICDFRAEAEIAERQIPKFGSEFKEHRICDFRAEAQMDELQMAEEQITRRQYKTLFSEAIQALTQLEQNPKRANLLHIAMSIVEDIKLLSKVEELSYNLIKKLVKAYFPEIKMKNIIEIFYVMSKIVKFTIIAGMQAQIRGFNAKLILATQDFICYDICPWVAAMGGWKVVLAKIGATITSPMRGYMNKSLPTAYEPNPTKPQALQTMPNNYAKPAMIVGIIGGIACAALCIGKAIIDSKRNN